MSGILVVAEVTEGRLAESLPHLVAAAAVLGGRITVGIAHAAIEQVAAEGAIAGVAEIVAVRTPSPRFAPELHAAAVQAMIEDVRPGVVLVAFTIRAASFAAGLAETLDLGFAGDVVALGRGERGELLATRPIYGGKVHAELAFAADAPALVLLRADAWPAAAPAGSPPVREIPLRPTGELRVRHREYRRPEQGVDLTRADVIFAIGRGVGEQAKLQPFAELARRMDVALGASRPLIDAGWLPAPHQVGQTGVTVKPRLYVAFGISGAMQHLVGMQASSTVVAVNKDPDAAIFDFADIGAVADIHEVAKEMQAILSGAGMP